MGLPAACIYRNSFNTCQFVTLSTDSFLWIHPHVQIIALIIRRDLCRRGPILGNLGGPRQFHFLDIQGHLVRGICCLAYWLRFRL